MVYIRNTGQREWKGKTRDISINTEDYKDFPLFSVYLANSIGYNLIEKCSFCAEWLYANPTLKLLATYSSSAMGICVWNAYWSGLTIHYRIMLPTEDARACPCVHLHLDTHSTWITSLAVLFSIIGFLLGSSALYIRFNIIKLGECSAKIILDNLNKVILVACDTAVI